MVSTNVPATFQRLSTKKGIFVCTLLYNLFYGQKAPIPACLFQNWGVTPQDESMGVFLSFAPIGTCCLSVAWEPNHTQLKPTHSFRFRHRIKLAPWNLPQPVIFTIYEILHLQFKMETIASNTNSWSLSLQPMAQTLTINLDRWAKSENRSNSFSTKIDYTKVCIRFCMYVNYNWSNSTVKSVLQFMFLDSVGFVTYMCEYWLPCFPSIIAHHLYSMIPKFENAWWMCAVAISSELHQLHVHV